MFRFSGYCSIWPVSYTHLHYVDDIHQVVDLALLKEKVANPLF